MSKPHDFTGMQNPLYGVQSEVIQAAIRRARRERSEAVHALIRRIFNRDSAEREDAGSPPDAITSCNAN